MGYTLGVDLGTTFSAAAVNRDGRVEMVSLGGIGDVVPSVVLLREDGTVITGEAAVRRGVTEPHRLAREFKRRFGQPEPVMLAGTPYSPEALAARLLASIVDAVVAREGSRPERICLSHPANWGPFKRDLFEHVVRLAEITEPVVFTTEPEAAAVSYARAERVEPGAIVAVYDLGGGTFDAAVLRKTETGFEILGKPEGIEQLGGIDVDAAVFHHVTGALGDRLSELDEDDPDAIAAVARLRRDCVDAKEALSADTDASIPVLLPGCSSQVRLTRAELETMVRPMLSGTIDALRRALASAHITADELTSVLLVGGGSRMPIVAQMVGAELGRPVAVDAHPKHAVAMGAAWLAAAPPTAIAEPATQPLSQPVAEPAAAATAVMAAVPSGDPADDPSDEEEDYEYDDEGPAFRPPPGREDAPRRRRPLILVAGLVAVLLLAAGGYAFARSRSSDDTASGGSEPQTAEAKLASIATADKPKVTADLLDRWAPQLGLFKDGVKDPDGTVITYDDILETYHQQLSRFPGTVLVDSDDWPASFLHPGAYAIMLRRVFSTPDEVNQWCQDNGFDPLDCFAKRISRTGQPPDNNLGWGDQSSGSTGGSEPSSAPTASSTPTPSDTPTATDTTTPTDTSSP